ncbi:MAG: CBS domain-containing protein [Sulfurovum sp.]
MLVESVMTQKDKLVIISPMATVREAIKAMKSNRVRSIIVDKSKEEGAYGLLTFKNILQSIVAEDGDIDLLNVYDIASTPAFSISTKLDVKYAAKMMVQNSIKRLIVSDNNELKGILTMTDIVAIVMESID